MTAVKERIVGGAVRAFGKRAEVCEVAALSPRLRRLRFAGDAVAQMTWSAGDKIKLRVGDGVMRSYTPARVDARTGTMDIVFHLHGNGPAAAWAAAAQRGDTAWFFGPKTSMPAVGRDIAWALFFGDETALGLGLALAEAHGDRADVSGAIELDRADLGAVAALGSTLTPVARDAEYGDALLRWLAERELPTGGGIVWLSGEARTALRLRAALLERGLSKNQLRIKPYWSVRGAAHRKELERGALRR